MIAGRVSGRAWGPYNARHILHIPMRRTTHVVHIPTYDIALLCMQRSPWRCGGGGDRASRDDVAVVYHSDYARDEGGRRLAAARTARPHRQGVSGAPALPHTYSIHIYTLTALYVYSTRRRHSFFQFRHTHADSHTHTQAGQVLVYIYMYMYT